MARCMMIPSYDIFSPLDIAAHPGVLVPGGGSGLTGSGPLGGGLAIPARLHMFRWLKRYRECGNPCQTCAHECPVQAIGTPVNVRRR